MGRPQLRQALYDLPLMLCPSKNLSAIRAACLWEMCMEKPFLKKLNEKLNTEPVRVGIPVLDSSFKLWSFKQVLLDEKTAREIGFPDAVC